MGSKWFEFTQLASGDAKNQIVALYRIWQNLGMLSKLVFVFQ